LLRTLCRWPENRGITSLGDGQDQRLTATRLIKILVQLQTELPDVDPHRAVLEGVIAGRLMKKSVSNLMLRQVMSMTVDCTLGEVLQKLPETRALLKRRAADDPLNKLPSFIGQKVVSRRGLGC